ncbi:hypothetical protein B0H19DRAFT_1277077 [Mycena capillaripes]|nr:hypothetical protein B0H19DRAFT_1277077 [Mycena capillaripes]
MKSQILNWLSVLLHLTLIVIHLILLVVWSKKLEHLAVFLDPLQVQRIVNFLITPITTSFVTVYSAVLVFVTQLLSTRQNLRTERPLTATHDTAAALARIWSAVLYPWHQKKVPASIIGVSSAFLYLGNILVLHVTTPALFSLEMFNMSRSGSVVTSGLPAFDFSRYDMAESSARSTAWQSDLRLLRDYALQYATSSLNHISSVLDATTLGLHDGSLYEVLALNSGEGPVSVAATGFNITCGFLTVDNNTAAYDDVRGYWALVLNGSDYLHIDYTPPGRISTVPELQGVMTEDAIPYSTITILDSNGSNGSWINLSKPVTSSLNTSVFAIQLLRCLQSLVSQTAIVDAQSRQLISVTPPIQKTSSTWCPMATPPELNAIANPLAASNNSILDLWGTWYSVMPGSHIQRGFFTVQTHSFS